MATHAAPSEQRNREVFFSLIGQHLPGLYRFVRSALTQAEAVGDLLPRELNPEDVVDAVVLRAYHQFAREPPRGKLESWLVGLAREHLAAEIKRLRSWRRRTERRLEEDVPETPPEEEVSTLGEEILYFYEPEEDWKLEDVLPDLEVPTPEEVAETAELRWCVRAAMAALPSEWRRALLLRHEEDLDDAELARSIGKPESEVRRILESARHYLRQRLVESGCTFRPADA